MNFLESQLAELAKEREEMEDQRIAAAEGKLK